jgi:hypothetical protein
LSKDSSKKYYYDSSSLLVHRSCNKSRQTYTTTMPIHGIDSLIEGRVNYSYALIAVGVVTVALSIKAWASGRKNTWERDWAGKMVLVVVGTARKLDIERDDSLISCVFAE